MTGIRPHFDTLRRNPPARRRLTWIRWSMTLFFALTTAACLIALALFAARSDVDSRHRVDTDLLDHARQISMGVTTDQDGLIMSTPPPPGTNLDQNFGVNAIGSAPAGFIDGHGIAYSSPSAKFLPSSATISRIYDAVTTNRTTAYVTATGNDGQLLRWVAVPVGESHTAIVILGTSTISAVAHSTVVLGLVAAVFGLTLAAALAGHLLSGLAMRPAIRQVEQQEQFLREAAHELRTPLATISLITESGIRHPETALTALHHVDERLGKITALLGSLLDRARADTTGDAIEKRPLRLDQLVDVTVSEMRSADRVTVSTSETVVVGDANLLAQAVRNLVENAIRHAPESPVDVTVAQRRVIVSDGGPGMSSFSSLDDREAPASPGAGTGTGLSIVTWVADIHDAEVTFDTPSGGGLRVVLQFPSPSGRGGESAREARKMRSLGWLTRKHLR